MLFPSSHARWRPPQPSNSAQISHLGGSLPWPFQAELGASKSRCNQGPVHLDQDPQGLNTEGMASLNGGDREYIYTFAFAFSYIMKGVIAVLWVPSCLPGILLVENLWFAEFGISCLPNWQVRGPRSQWGSENCLAELKGRLSGSWSWRERVEGREACRAWLGSVGGNALALLLLKSRKIHIAYSQFTLRGIFLMNVEKSLRPGWSWNTTALAKNHEPCIDCSSLLFMNEDTCMAIPHYPWGGVLPRLPHPPMGDWNSGQYWTLCIPWFSYGYL